MSIGTAVPSASQLAAVKHYFIQSVPVTQTYTAGDYELEAVALVERLFDEGHETLVMTGGSMFYIDAVCNGLDNLPDGIRLCGPSCGKGLEKKELELLLRSLG